MTKRTLTTGLLALAFLAAGFGTTLKAEEPWDTLKEIKKRLEKKETPKKKKAPKKSETTASSAGFQGGLVSDTDSDGTPRLTSRQSPFPPSPGPTFPPAPPSIGEQLANSQIQNLKDIVDHIKKHGTT